MKTLVIRHLTFGHIKGPIVINDCSIELNSGMVLLCGEEGSGKTTFFDLVSGVQDLFYGKIFVCDREPRHAAIDISYLTSTPIALSNKTLLDNLKFACDATNVSYDRIDKIKDDWLEQNRNKKFKKLSYFDKCLFCLKRAEIKQPKLLL